MPAQESEHQEQSDDRVDDVERGFGDDTSRTALVEGECVIQCEHDHERTEEREPRPLRREHVRREQRERADGGPDHDVELTHRAGVERQARARRLAERADVACEVTCGPIGHRRRDGRERHHARAAGQRDRNQPRTLRLADNASNYERPRAWCPGVSRALGRRPIRPCGSVLSRGRARCARTHLWCLPDTRRVTNLALAGISPRAGSMHQAARSRGRSRRCRALWC